MSYNIVKAQVSTRRSIGLELRLQCIIYLSAVNRKDHELARTCQKLGRWSVTDGCGNHNPAAYRAPTSIIAVGLDFGHGIILESKKGISCDCFCIDALGAQPHLRPCRRIT